ncbi:hypothetical protein ACFQ2M_09060 [Kitasatospora saccharophila]|uniref:hypothetical protein n=1 Tax=Kitasatospora saccharophila TaxID=407973 RepID=UPI00362B0D90
MRLLPGGEVAAVRVLDELPEVDVPGGEAAGAGLVSWAKALRTVGVATYGTGGTNSA